MTLKMVFLPGKQQELINMVNEQGGDIGWNEVNGINRTEDQKWHYSRPPVH